jgi:dihydroorotate dehydrogenase (fumarate)
MSSIEAGWIDDEDDGPAGMGHVVPSGPALDGPAQLQTTYLGLTLPTPVVASSSPFTGDLASMKAMQAAGIGAVVLPSLFEEQLTHEAEQVQRMANTGSDANPEAPAGYHSPLDDYNDGATRYIKLVRDAREALSIPVIASLNGSTPGGWTRYASLLADAGADAIELNLYRVAADPTVTGRDIETDMLRVTESVVTAAGGIPIAVKLSPYVSALANLAPQLVDAGASGLVLFNRFYQPDIDPETLSAGPHLVLSDSDELRLPLRWCALLHGRVDASLAATTGVHTARDVIKVLLAGADVAMTTSSLLRHGPDHARVLVDGLTDWMTLHGYGTVAGMVGAVSQRNVADPAAYERANYLQTLTSYASTFLR